MKCKYFKLLYTFQYSSDLIETACALHISPVLSACSAKSETFTRGLLTLFPHFRYYSGGRCELIAVANDTGAAVLQMGANLSHMFIFISAVVACWSGLT